jgi:Ras GTPase-activating-like protein IQGAP2/3
MGNLDSVADYSKADSLMVKLFLTYARGAKDQQYYKELLKPLLKKLLETPDLDLETEPQMVSRRLIGFFILCLFWGKRLPRLFLFISKKKKNPQIYKNLIKEEELQTGQKSTLPYNAPRDEMLNNPKVRERFIKRKYQSDIKEEFKS